MLKKFEVEIVPNTDEPWDDGTINVKAKDHAEARKKVRRQLRLQGAKRGEVFIRSVKIAR